MKKIYITFSLLGLLLVSCEDWIQGPEDEPQNGGQSIMSASFSDIQTEVFSKSCATSGCHNGSINPNLSAGEAYNNLVNQPSAQVPSMLRVKPGDSNNSYLMKKLTGDGTSVMPPSGQLSQVTIDSIAAWIDRGALNN
jgi:hypothetical protein